MATILRAIVGYFILLIMVRVLRRRSGAQMTLFEFVLIFLMGGLIIGATVQHDRSATNCECAVIVVGFLHRTVSWAKSKSPRFGTLLDGTPVVIIRKGEWQQEVIYRTGLRRDDIEAAGRAMGITDLNDIDYAVLERNGHISVIKKEA